MHSRDAALARLASETQESFGRSQLEASRNQQHLEAAMTQTHASLEGMRSELSKLQGELAGAPLPAPTRPAPPRHA